MVELYIVDLVSSNRLEPLVNQLVLSICDPQLLIIKDTSESGVSNEPTIGSVFVLEERFDQQSPVLNICS
jgi:hypothetical protein